MSMYEEDLEDGEDTILLAEIDWKPMPVYEPWTDPDFAQMIANRIKGVTEEGFANEVKLYQDALNMLPQYNEYDIRKEIAQWEFNVPNKNDFDISSHAASYALQIQYKTRLSEIYSVVFSHFEFLSSAQKNLKEMAVKIAPGSNKHDKDGIASFTVSPFTIASSHAKRLLSYLDSVMKNIDFAASQMDRLMREHQSLSRINQNFHNEGLSALYSKDRPSLKRYNDDSATVRTRNERLK